MTLHLQQKELMLFIVSAYEEDGPRAAYGSEVLVFERSSIPAALMEVQIRNRRIPIAWDFLERVGVSYRAERGQLIATAKIEVTYDLDGRRNSL